MSIHELVRFPTAALGELRLVSPETSDHTGFFQLSSTQVGLNDFRLYFAYEKKAIGSSAVKLRWVDERKKRIEETLAFFRVIESVAPIGRYHLESIYLVGVEFQNVPVWIRTLGDIPVI